MKSLSQRMNESFSVFEDSSLQKYENMLIKVFTWSSDIGGDEYYTLLRTKKCAFLDFSAHESLRQRVMEHKGWVTINDGQVKLTNTGEKAINDFHRILQSKKFLKILEINKSLKWSDVGIDLSKVK